MSTRNIEKRIVNFTHTTNKFLKQLGEDLGISIKLTSYTAHHSFATKFKSSEKVSLSFIMESQGHSNNKTTMDYSSDFEDDKIRKHHEVLLKELEGY